jgi:predicted nuclease of restriction endonuclease-like (RecB) superfamily
MKPEELSFYRDLLGDIKTRVRQGQRRAALSANAEMIHMYWDIGRMIAARQEKEGWGAGVIPRLAVDLKNELPEQKGFSARNIGRMIAFFREYSILPQSASNLTGADQIFAIGAQYAPQFNDLPILQQPVAELQSTDYESVVILPPAVAKLETPANKAEILPPPVAKLENSEVSPGYWKALLSISWAHNVVLIEKIKHFPTRYWYAKQAFEQGWTRDTLMLQIKNRAHERQGAAITNFATTLPEAHAAIAGI